MLKLTLLTTFFFLLLSCNEKGTKENTAGTAGTIDTVAVLNDPMNNLNVQTSAFSQVDSSGILMFPLSVGETARDGRSSSYKPVPAGSWWNIIFYNAHTAEYYLLSERKMLIGNMDMRYNSRGYPDVATSKKHLFYQVVVDDYNGDKKLTSEDPEYLFVTDKEGRNFRQVSPAGYQLRSWQFIPSTGKVVMTVTKDTDNNKKFGDKDEVASFEIDMDKETRPTEIFSDAFKNKLKLLYDKDWKRIDE